jgi:hypothetical protein
VGRLLSADTVRWSELAGFVKRDDRFLGFIVRHIDETVPATMVDSIEQNARQKCPESAAHRTAAPAERSASQRLESQSDASCRAAETDLHGR